MHAVAERVLHELRPCDVCCNLCAQSRHAHVGASQKLVQLLLRKMVVRHDVVDGLVDFRRGHRDLVFFRFQKFEALGFELLKNLGSDFLLGFGRGLRAGRCQEELHALAHVVVRDGRIVNDGGDAVAVANGLLGFLRGLRGLVDRLRAGLCLRLGRRWRLRRGRFEGGHGRRQNRQQGQSERGV